LVPGRGRRNAFRRGGLSLNAHAVTDELDQSERGPERRCVVTGAVGPKTALIRFVVGPDGALVPDVTGRLPGRGIWLSASRQAVETAVTKRLFARAARSPVTVSPTLCDDVEALLARQLRNALGLAYKAGAVAAGFAKADALIAKGRAAALMEACDAGPHGVAKLGARAASAGVPVISILTSEEMGLALGRENMVHAALGTERLGLRVVEEARRLAGFRPDPEHPTLPPESEES